MRGGAVAPCATVARLRLASLPILEVDVTDSLQALLRELEAFGRDNDRAVADRPRRMLNITRDTGELLSVLVRATYARRVLEIGTSNGYSTLWLASAAAAVGGHVTTVEMSDHKIALAAQTFERSGLSSVITQVHDDAGALLRRSADESFDLVFLDSERTEYSAWWPDLKRSIRKGGLLVVDNATSHAEEMAPFAALLSADRDMTMCMVPIGNGELLATRSL